MSLRTLNRLASLAVVFITTGPAQGDACIDWQDKSPPGPNERYYHAMAYDSDRHQTVLFGGYDGAEYKRQTYEWSGTAWVERSSGGPPNRIWHAMAYDTSRHRTLLTGGTNGATTSTATYEWDGTAGTWALQPTGFPGRYGHAMVYDTNRQVAVVFGGTTSVSSPATNLNGQTWERVGTTWMQRTPAHSPSPRYLHAMAYDSARHVTVLFGGFTAGGASAETWEWDGTDWTQIFPSTSPAARYAAPLTFDSDHGFCVLHGGSGPSPNGVETWQWDGSNWSRPTIHTLAPSARLYHALAYDSFNHQTVLVGGFGAFPPFQSPQGDTWHYAGADSWVAVVSTHAAPATRELPAAAFDSSRGLSVFFGGTNGSVLGDTWEWDGLIWFPRQPATSPPARFNAAMAYDSARGVAVLFGGDGGPSDLSDTWEWNGTSWSNPTPALHPSARQSHAMVYDSARGVTVLFGGDAPNFNDETWEWNGSNWTQRNPASSPSARDAHAMAYDSGRGVTVLFGGGGATNNDETWEWNGTNWTQRFPATRPPNYGNHAMAFDSARCVTVLYGGFLSPNTVSDDTWLWNGTNWAQVSTAGVASLSEHAMVFDSVRGKCVIYGGTNTTSPLVDNDRVVELQNDRPSITGQPANQVACAGDKVTLSVVACGPGLTYQWRKGGIDIGGATGSSLNLNRVSVGDTGSYDVVVTHAACSLPSTAASLTVNAGPIISQPPQSASRCAGDNVNFCVTASGTPSPTYQWRKDGVDINGATSACFSISSVTVADAGDYTVIVSTVCGTTESSPAATLTIATPIISQQPAGDLRSVGQSFSMSVLANSPEALTFQWRLRGIAIAGATANSLTINPVTVADGGTYDVVVTAASCTSISDPAVLTVQSSGDPDGSGGSQGNDVQGCVEAQLRAGPPIQADFACDLDGDGDVDAVDLQMFVNLLLSL